MTVRAVAVALASVILAGCGTSTQTPAAAPTQPAGPAASSTLAPAPRSGSTTVAGSMPFGIPGSTQTIGPGLLQLLPSSAAQASPCPDTGDAVPSVKPSRPNGWPVILGDYESPQFPVVAPNGMAYFVQSGELIAIDPAGREPAGWPKKLAIPPPGANDYAPPNIAIGADGTVYVSGANLIYAFGADGALLKGWPYRGSVRVECPACTITLLPISQGVYTDLGSGQATLLRRDGTVAPGWPVALPGGNRTGTMQMWTGPGDTLYVDDPETTTMTAYSPAGTRVPGWPITDWSGMSFDPGGRIYVWKHSFNVTPGARYSGPSVETQVAALDGAGRPLPGWPIKFDGPVSQPVFGPDGTVYLALGTSSGSGSFGSSIRSGAIVALRADGSPKSGWPVSLPEGYWVVGSMPAVSQASSDPPTIAADGTVFVMAQGGAPGSGAGIVEAFGSDGRLLPGWPRAIDTLQTSNVLAASSGSGWSMVAPGGVVFLVVGNRIVALRTDGTLASGWPIARPCDAAPEWVELTPDGLLVIWNAGPKPYFGSLAILYRPDGSVMAH